MVWLMHFERYLGAVALKVHVKIGTEQNKMQFNRHYSTDTTALQASI